MAELLDMDEESLSLVVRLMELNAKDAAWVTNVLMEGYRNDCDRLSKEITLIRTGITKLFLTGYQPTESAIMKALYPRMD